MKRHWPTLSLASALYLWGSLSPGNNLERFLGGRVWELLPNYNPVAFCLALGIVGIGLGIAYVPDLIVRYRSRERGDHSDRLAQLTNELFDHVRQRPPVFASSSRSTDPPGPPPFERVVRSSQPRPLSDDRPAFSTPASASQPLSNASSERVVHDSRPQEPPHCASPPETPAAHQSHRSSADPLYTPPAVDQPAAPHTRPTHARRAAFRSRPKPVEELIRPVPVEHSTVLGLTEPAIYDLPGGSVSVNYLGIWFVMRGDSALQHLDDFVATAADLRIRFALPQTLDLTAYLEERSQETPADALRAYQTAVNPGWLWSNYDGPETPLPVFHLSAGGFFWKSAFGVSLTWREIAAFTATVQGARKGNQSLPSVVDLSTGEAGPLASLEAALEALSRARS